MIWQTQMLRQCVKLGQALFTSTKGHLRSRLHIMMSTMARYRTLRRMTALLLFTSCAMSSLGTMGGSAIAAEATALPTLEVQFERLSQLTKPDAQILAQAKKQLPSAIAAILRQDLSRQTGIPAKKFQIVTAVPQDWPDGCLGLAETGEMCTQTVVSGWRVTFSNRTRRWVYRTDAAGKVYRLEPAYRSTRPGKNQPAPRATQPTTSKLKPEVIPVSELPPTLPEDVLFEAIATGGIAGQTTQTTLHRNGKLVHRWLQADGTPRPSTTHQLTPAQVKTFQTMLQTHSLQPFHRQAYPATSGSADFFTVTVSSPTATVRYADIIQERLPVDLKLVVQAWNDLMRSV